MSENPPRYDVGATLAKIHAKYGKPSDQEKPPPPTSFPKSERPKKERAAKNKKAEPPKKSPPVMGSPELEIDRQNTALLQKSAHLKKLYAKVKSAEKALLRARNSLDLALKQAREETTETAPATLFGGWDNEEKK